MAQTSRELFEGVGAVLSCDAQYVALCQEADKIYPADRFEPEKAEASAIDRYMVSKLKGDWFMPWWYRWYYGITEMEVSRYLLRALLQFRDWKANAELQLRPGERALMVLLSSRDAAPLFSYFSAYNPIGILLRRTYAVYFAVSGDSPPWYWQWKRGFDSLVDWALGNKAPDVGVIAKETGYEIRPQGQSITPKQLHEAVQKQAETSWWQVFKKRELRREYPFDIKACHQAWETHWLQRERDLHEKEVVEEDFMKNPKNELTWTLAAAKPLRDSATIQLDGEICQMGDVYELQMKRFKGCINELQEIVKEDNQIQFNGRLETVKTKWGETIGKQQRIIDIVTGEIRRSKNYNPLKENLERFSNIDTYGKQNWAGVMALVRAKQQQNPWAIEHIEALWTKIKEEVLAYQGRDFKDWLSSGNEKGIDGDYEAIKQQLNRVKRLLGDGSTNTILEAVLSSEQALDKHYKALKEAQGIEHKLIKLRELSAIANDDMQVINKAMMLSADIDVDAFERKADEIIDGFVFNACRTAMYESLLVTERDALLSGLNEIEKALSEKLREQWQKVTTTMVVTPMPAPSAGVSLDGQKSSDEIPVEDRVYSYMAQCSYQLLGVEPGATKAELTTAYRRKALICHPDKSGNPDCVRDFINLGKAHLFLTDKGGRLEYVHKDEANSEAFCSRNAQQRSAVAAEMYRENKKDLEEMRQHWDVIAQGIEQFGRSVDKHSQRVDRLTQNSREVKEGIATLQAKQEVLKAENLAMKKHFEIERKELKKIKDSRMQHEQAFNQKEQESEKIKEQIEEMRQERLQESKTNHQQLDCMMLEVVGLVAALNEERSAVRQPYSSLSQMNPIHASEESHPSGVSDYTDTPDRTSTASLASITFTESNTTSQPADVETSSLPSSTSPSRSRSSSNSLSSPLVTFAYAQPVPEVIPNVPEEKHTL